MKGFLPGTLLLGCLITLGCTEADKPSPISAPNPSPRIAPNVSSDVDESYNRRTPFVPLDNPLLLPSDAADYLQDDELILGLEWEGEAHAYPIGMVTFHHIVNDTLAGNPFVITY